MSAKAKPTTPTSSATAQQDATQATSQTTAQDEPGTLASLRHDIILTLEKHGHAIAYGLLGFLIALLILIIGFWPTFLLSIFAAIGVLIGTYQDGSIQLKRLLARILRIFR